jgi:hypothetical protein
VPPTTCILPLPIVRYEETRVDGPLTLTTLAFVGTDRFTVDPAYNTYGERIDDCYVIRVQRNRLETPEEVQVRVAKETAAIKDYHHRQALLRATLTTRTEP